MTDYKVKFPDDTNAMNVWDMDYFEIEEGGTLVFYRTEGPHDGHSVSLGDVASSNDYAVRAYKEWEWVKEN